VARASATPQWQQSIVMLSAVGVGAAVIGLLYWAQVVFVPVALTFLVTFLLTPPVRWLERRGFRRGPAVVTVMLIAMVLIGETGWLVTRQMSSLAEELPDYTANIQRKVQSIREMSGGWDRFQKMLDEVVGPAPAADGANAGDETPRVVVRPESPLMGQWPHFLGSAVEVVAGLALVMVLSVFALIKREDLRNRFLRLIGSRRLAYTTKAVDDAGERMSRYLFTQALVNLGYGLALAIGLALIGVKYAILWGFIAAILRYVPYIGAWISIAFPLAISVATAETWFEPLATLALFGLLEVVTYNAIEPIFFKRSMGVSEVAQLVSAAFWGFLWGPVGLVLSAPLTVCLLVLGKYVPQLEFLVVLLGDDPPLEPDVSLYQRLLAWDEDDATQLIAEQSKLLPADSIYDDMLIPTLNFMKRDRLRGEITGEDEAFILRASRDLIDEALPATDLPAAKEVGPRVLACPAVDGGDGLALDMLAQLMQGDRWQFDIIPKDMLTAEIVQLAVQNDVQVVCIGSVPPGGLAHSRYLCKRLRAQLPNAKILVGRWGRKGVSESEQQQLLEAGADAVTNTLTATRRQLVTWQPIITAPKHVDSADDRDAIESSSEALVTI
jgi:predicted PurR-regulated permease PerM